MEDIAGRLATDHTEGRDEALPSVEGVVSIAEGVREVLFPGYGRTRRLHTRQEQVSGSTALLNRIESRLRIEVQRALTHAGQSSLKIHSFSDRPAETRCPATLANRFLQTLPDLKATLQTDIQAAFEGDPAARTNDEILLCYPGILAIITYRMAREMHQLQIPYLPRILTEWAHRETGIDIHPGAQIGSHFFIDHGTGVVIGETCQIGCRVTLYQGVTLGAWSFSRDDDGNLIRGEKRHPTLEDGVTVYSNATILGGSTVIGAGSQVGSSVTLSRSVPPNTIVTIDKPSLRFREAG